MKDFIKHRLREELDLYNYTYNINNNKFELLYKQEIVGLTMFSNIMKNEKFNGESYISIWGLEIKEKYRNKGIGGVLMEKIIEYFSSKVNILELQVMEKNIIAVKLYKKFGFATYLNTGHGVLYMYKKLN